MYEGRELDLSDYQTMKNNALDIVEAVESGRMPLGNLWSAAKVETFKIWVADGAPKGGTSSGGKQPGWHPTNAVVLYTEDGCKT